jgi:hypothetical protein
MTFELSLLARPANGISSRTARVKDVRLFMVYSLSQN